MGLFDKLKREKREKRAKTNDSYKNRWQQDSDRNPPGYSVSDPFISDQRKRVRFLLAWEKTSGRITGKNQETLESRTSGFCEIREAVL